MALVDSKSKEILKRREHDYSLMTDEELKQIVKGVSYQDAGNYDGKFVGTIASNELLFRSAKKTQCWTMIIAIISMVVAILSLGMSVYQIIA